MSFSHNLSFSMYTFGTLFKNILIYLFLVADYIVLYSKTSISQTVASMTRTPDISNYYVYDRRQANLLFNFFDNLNLSIIQIFFELLSDCSS